MNATQIKVDSSGVLVTIAHDEENSIVSVTSSAMGVLAELSIDEAKKIADALQAHGAALENS